MACRLLLVSGSLRGLSANTAALRTAQRVAPAGVEAVVFDRLAHLPPFNPDDDTAPLHPEVAALRGEVHAAAAIVFSTPEYAGALPGSFKNLLDWTIGDGEPGSIYEKPVAWIVTSPRGADGAHRELRAVLGYAHAAIVEDACASVPVTNAMVGPDGLVSDAAAVARIFQAITVLAGHLGCAAAAAGTVP